MAEHWYSILFERHFIIYTVCPIFVNNKQNSSSSIQKEIRDVSMIKMDKTEPDRWTPLAVGHVKIR